MINAGKCTIGHLVRFFENAGNQQRQFYSPDIAILFINPLNA